MTSEQLHKAHTARPFRPFTIHMGDGRSLLVSHPEFLAYAPGNRTAALFTLQDDMHILDLLLMTEIEVHGGSRTDGAAA